MHKYAGLVAHPSAVNAEQVMCSILTEGHADYFPVSTLYMPSFFFYISMHVHSIDDPCPREEGILRNGQCQYY